MRLDVQNYTQLKRYFSGIDSIKWAYQNFLKGISLFARCSVFGLTIIEIPKLINAEITTNTNSVIISLDNNNVICLKSLVIPIYTQNAMSEIK